ncbi:hypothetical protein GCM10007278_05800 [Paenalcaligenes hominis]|nr:hypothetical protein GCM10007278_05800 [Paenalcaligenes hominis]
MLGGKVDSLSSRMDQAHTFESLRNIYNEELEELLLQAFTGNEYFETDSTNT